MVQRVATYRRRNFNAYVPACAYAADVIHGAAYQVDFGTPAASAADNILDNQSIASAGSTTTLLGNQSDAPFGRNLRVIASGAATSSVTVRGRDYLGQPMTEQFTLNGANSVVGVKAFYWIDSVAWSGTSGTTIDLGWGARLGLPYRTAQVTAESVNGVGGSVGTLTAGSLTDPQVITTADPRGLYTPTGTLNGSNKICIEFMPHNYVNGNGNGGLYGMAHFYS